MEKVGSPVGSGQVQKQRCGVFRAARSGCGCSRRESAGAEGVGPRRAGGLGGRGQRDHRRALSGEDGKCGPAPPPVRGKDPGAHGLPGLPSRFRHPELLFPLQPGRLQPLSTGEGCGRGSRGRRVRPGPGSRDPGVGGEGGAVNRWALLPPSFSQRLTLSQRALANIHSQLQGLEREAVPQFPSAQVGGPGAPPAPQLPGGEGGGGLERWAGS